MKGIAEYLKFTFESGEEYPDKWLPTLDTSLRVSPSNIVEYKYYEKPTTTNTTLRMSTAMEFKGIFPRIGGDCQGGGDASTILLRRAAQPE